MRNQNQDLVNQRRVLNRLRLNLSLQKTLGNNLRRSVRRRDKLNTNLTRISSLNQEANLKESEC
jgi:hypothetical protein